MKKLALAFSSKDRVDLTVQTWPRLCDAQCAAYWLDGSTDQTALEFFRAESRYATYRIAGATGGPDRTIVHALSAMLASDVGYTYLGILENDCLLDEDWLEPTLALFDNQEGLPVGAVSARSFHDRILIQRDQYAVMHNVGAGHVIFTREAAQIILNNYRTGWWPENRAVFSQLSGLDIGKWGAFHHNEQMITADWSWDTILAAHGLATVALTPSKASMIGQDIAAQGLRLTQADVEERRDNAAFAFFASNLRHIRAGKRAIEPVDHLLRTRNGFMMMPHHAEKHGGLFSGNPGRGSSWTTRWNQACGPFVYVAGDKAVFSIPLFGPCAFHVTAGPVSLHDTATGYNVEMDLTGQDQAVTVAVPRDMQTGIVRLTFGPGACLAAIETTYEQPVWKDVTFDYSKLPETA